MERVYDRAAELWDALRSCIIEMAGMGANSARVCDSHLGRFQERFSDDGFF